MITRIAAMAICTKVQYNADMQKEPVLDAERISKEMKLLSGQLGYEVTLPKLAELMGIRYNTLFKAINEKDRRVAADLVARLALVFHCSIEYLMGIAQTREPITLNLSELLDGLIKTAKTLPKFRQRDLLIVAKAYQDADDPTAEMVLNLLEEVEEFVDAEMRKKLSAALEARRSARAASRQRPSTAQEGDQEVQSE